MRFRSTRRVVRRLAALFGLGAIAASALIVARSDPPPSAPRVISAMPVDARAIRLQTAYEQRQQFSGQVEARRVSALGFDAAGQLDRVLVDEGERVEAGDLLAVLDSARLAARRAELIAARAEADARLALATATLQRFAGVIEQGGVSRQGLDEAREAQRTARATLRLAEQRIASIEVDLEKTELRAPFAGTITARTADEGRVLGNGETILRLQAHAAPEIRIGIAGRALENLAVGQHYPLTWRGRVLDARLRTLLPVRNAGARTVDAVFDLAGPADAVNTPISEQLLPGDTVALSLDTRVMAAGAWLPMTALATGERGLWGLYIVRPDKPDGANPTWRIERRTVDVLHQTTDRVYVRGDLRTGDLVVQRGLQRVVPGQRVVIAPRPPEARS